MTIIPLSFSIERNPHTGKKLYKQLHTKKILLKPGLPKKWEITKEFDDVTTKQAHSYAIRCDEDLIVVDCDDLESTELIDSVLPEGDHYIVISDKGYKHYYFKPSNYYQDSKIYKNSRLALGKIDVLHGKALVFAPCPNNTTKKVFKGSLDSLTPIPDSIVDILATKVKTKALAKEEDYKPVASFLAPIIEQSLALYTHHTKGGNYLDMQALMQLVTPAQYREELAPDYNPSRLNEGRMTYLHAISFKISNDPSVSFALHCELITTISEMLQRPMDPARLKGEIFDYVQGEVNGTRWQYSENATNKPLVSINGGEYCPIYRTLDDMYILSKPSGAIETISSTQKFRLAMASKNYQLLVNSSKINIDNNIAMKKLQEAMQTLTIVDIPYHNTGVYEEDGSMYYNTYIPTKYLGIIRGEYKQELEYKGPQTHPTITAIIKNLMYDNLESTGDDTMYDKFIQFLSYKFKTLEYSPVVFQLMGRRGSGKNRLLDIFQQLTKLKGQVKFNIKTEFNGELADKLFLVEEEGLVTQHLVNAVKELSGSSEVTVRKLYQEKQIFRNIGTYIFTTNKTTPMAETIDDRRFVTLSSFKAKRLDQLDFKNLDEDIALELEAFALCLRDTKFTNPKLYIDANQWHDEVHFNNFNEKQESTQHVPSKVANMVYTIHNMIGSEIHKTLVDCFGEGYHHVNPRRNSTMISIPLAKHPKLVRFEDSSTLTHEITREELKAVELDNLIKRDTNKLNPYGQAYYKLNIEVSPTQKEEWQAAYDGYSEVEGEDIDISE